MFYAQFVLSKKGPLAKIWLAAHWEKKLNRNQIAETNVEEAVNEILKPKVKIALRTTGHLLLGIVRIYSRKTKYLLADCNEALLRIKMAFRADPGGLTIEYEAEAPIDSILPMITLPEHYNSLEKDLVEAEEFEKQNDFDDDQGRFEVITMNDEYQERSAFGADFGMMDDFGESNLPGGIEDELSAIGISTSRASSVMEQLRNPLQANGSRSAIEPIALDEAVKPFGADIFGHSDLLGFSGDDGMGEPLPPGFEQGDLLGHDTFNNISLFPTEDVPMEGVEEQQPADDADLTSQSSFELGPVSQSALPQKAPARKRKRRLIIDQELALSAEVMKENMDDYEDILQPLDMAPPTRRLMRLRESGNVARLLRVPGSDMASKTLIHGYQDFLTVRIRDDVSIESEHADLRLELELARAEDIDLRSGRSSVMRNSVLDDKPLDPIPETENWVNDSMGLQPFDENSLGLLEPSADPNFGPGAADRTPFGELYPDNLADEPEPKRMREANAEPDLDEVIENKENMTPEQIERVASNTSSLLNDVVSKLKVSSSCTFTDIVPTTTKAKLAAQSFYSLLVLKKWDAVEVEQAVPFDTIQITEGPKLSQCISAKIF
ncbi:unnamed protein product, partial [Mesorhabditis spiculigera]